MVLSDKGKSVAEDSESSSDSGPPEERPAVAYTKRKNGPDLEKLDALYRPDILTMRSWSEDEYEEYDDYLIEKWEINGFDKNDKVYVVRSLNKDSFPFSLYSTSLIFSIFFLFVIAEYQKPQV